MTTLENKEEAVADAMVTALAHPSPATTAENAGNVTAFNGTTLSACTRMLGELMQHSVAYPFAVPVDTTIVTDYRDYIQHPMDLGTITNRLHSGGYTNLEEFESDVAMVWKNACVYNPPDNEVHQWALVLQDEFVNNMQKIRSVRDVRRIRSESRVGDSRKSSRSSRASEASGMSREMIRMRDKLSEMQKTIEQNDKLLRNHKLYVQTSVAQQPPQQPKPKQKQPRTDEMPFEQKRELAVAINGFTSAKLQKVVAIIRKRIPSFGEGDDELELDINSLDNSTLWELQTFVSSQKRRPPKSKFFLQALPSEPAAVPLSTAPEGITFRTNEQTNDADDSPSDSE